VHLTFTLLIGWVAFIFWRQEQTITASVMGVFFILSVFLCVVLHEFGHALAAGRYGIKTRDIILLPIGGVARLERMPTNPLHELWVALAGPAVNLDRAVELTLTGSQKDFPVVDDGRIEGILTQTNLLKALTARDRHPTITSAMQQNIVTVDSLDKLETAFAKLKECNCYTLPVTLNQKLVGLLTMDNLREYMRIREASTG